MYRLLKIQLYVNQHPLNNDDTVSNKYHIFLDDLSFCKKLYQDTQFFETDLCLPYTNLMRLPIKKLKNLVKENKDQICSKCYSNFIKYINKLEKNDTNQLINMLNK